MEALGVSQGEHELGERAAKFDNHLCPFLAVWLQAIYNSLSLNFIICVMGTRVTIPISRGCCDDERGYCRP